MQRMRQGFLKFYTLKLLGEDPAGMSGYDLMQHIEEETGFWRPSPGSIYPLLAAMEAAGLIHSRAEGDKKIYSLTAKGEEALVKAREAKAEAREGIRRSMRVLAGIFGEEATESLAEPWRMDHPRRTPQELHKRFAQLRGLLLDLLSRKLKEEEVKGISRILDQAIKELRAYAERD
jgi:DNA-binding PadR family transcriptional regulator